MTVYYVATWDTDKQDFTPQDGVPHGPWTKWGLRTALRLLREMGYEGRRGDPSVAVDAVGEESATGCAAT